MISKTQFNLKYTTDFGTYGLGDVGGFFIFTGSEAKKVPAWYTCRESFDYRVNENLNRSEWRKANMIGLLSPDVHVDFPLKRVNKLWNLLERKLGVKERSEFYRTNVPNCVLMSMSDWWLENAARRSAFSLFMRGYMVYQSKANTKGILGFVAFYDLAAKCEVAIELFVRGFTRYVPPEDFTIHQISGGFADFFSSKSNTKKHLKRHATH